MCLYGKHDPHGAKNQGTGHGYTHQPEHLP